MWLVRVESCMGWFWVGLGLILVHAMRGLVTLFGRHFEPRKDLLEGRNPQVSKNPGNFVFLDAVNRH